MQRSRPLALVSQALGAWAEAEAGRCILFLPVFMAAGVVAYFAWPDEPSAIPAAGMAAICLILAWALRTYPAALALLGAGFVAAGFAGARLETARLAPWADLPRRGCIVTGVVAAVEMLPDGRRITVTAPSLDGAAAIARAVRIRLRAGDGAVLAPGDTVRVRALLRGPSPPSYPGAWDTQRDAFFAGMAGYGFAIGDSAVVAAAGGVPPGRGTWQGVRETIAGRVMRALPGPNGAIAATLLTGLGAAIPAADRAAFQDSGLAHLLAVAGLHIGIVMGLVYFVVRRGLALRESAALHWPLRRIGALAALAAGLGYLELTGAHVPIMRSFAMACLVTLGLMTGRRAVSLRGLAIAAIVLMLASPDLVMGVSFQMSFAAVLALLAGWEAIAPWMARQQGDAWWRWPLGHAAAGIATSVLAGTASLPVAMYHFGNATLYYVPANLLAVPVTAFWVMPWGLAALILMPFGLEGVALEPMGWGIGALRWIAHGVAAWPDARVAVPQMPAAALVLALLGLVWLCLWRTRVRLAGIAIMAAGLAIGLTTKLPDILVGDGARLVAARLGGEVFVAATHGVSRFDREAPARLWGLDRSRDFPAGVQGAVSCSAAACRITAHGGVAVLLRRPDTPCPLDAVALSQGRLFCPGVVVDRTTIAARGATTVRLTAAGPVIRSAGDGARPWSLPTAQEVRLPPALTE